MQLPPLHPILVNFTAALLPASFISDVLGRVLRRSSLTVAAWWMLLYAALITPLTAAAGWFWMRSMRDMDHWQMGAHKWLGISMAFLLIALVCWRWRFHRRAESPGWIYLVIAAVIIAGLVVQGHLGASMTFGGNNPAQPTSRSTDHDAAHHDEATAWHDHIDVKD